MKPSKDARIAWDTQIDDKYDVWVERTEPYRGRLYVNLPDGSVYTEDVGISYDATLGADSLDVLAWVDIACTMIDGCSGAALG